MNRLISPFASGTTLNPTQGGTGINTEAIKARGYVLATTDSVPGIEAARLVGSDGVTIDASTPGQIVIGGGGSIVAGIGLTLTGDTLDVKYGSVEGAAVQGNSPHVMGSNTDTVVTITTGNATPVILSQNIIRSAKINDFMFISGYLRVSGVGATPLGFIKISSLPEPAANLAIENPIPVNVYMDIGGGLNTTGYTWFLSAANDGTRDHLYLKLIDDSTGTPYPNPADKLRTDMIIAFAGFYRTA